MLVRTWCYFAGAAAPHSQAQIKAMCPSQRVLPLCLVCSLSFLASQASTHACATGSDNDARPQPLMPHLRLGSRCQHHYNTPATCSLAITGGRMAHAMEQHLEVRVTVAPKPTICSGAGGVCCTSTNPSQPSSVASPCHPVLKSAHKQRPNHQGSTAVCAACTHCSASHHSTLLMHINEPHTHTHVHNYAMMTSYSLAAPTGTSARAQHWYSLFLTEPLST